MPAAQPPPRPRPDISSEANAVRAGLARRPSLARRAFYRACRAIVGVAFRAVYRLRFRGVERVPLTGGLLVVVNHQSHLDAPTVGVSLPRRDLTYLARHGLFKIPVFSWIISSLNSISINETQGDAAAIRTAIDILRDGRAVLIFPEGSRSPDGAMRPFKRGAYLLLRRAECMVLPAAVEGAFDAWPRGRGFPRLFRRRMVVAFGEPVSSARLVEMGPEEGLAHLSRAIDSLRLELRAELRRSTRGRYPPSGAGDLPAH